MYKMDYIDITPNPPAVLRNRSVGWLVNGYEAINKREVVKKVCLAPLHAYPLPDDAP